MPWFKVDDGFWSHPKTLQLSDGAQALWVRAGSWSMNHLSDGLIPTHVLPVLRSRRRYVDELVAVALWAPCENGYQFHDWNLYQPTREQVEADRHAAAERKRKSRERSHRDTPGDVREDSRQPSAFPTPPQPNPLTTSNEVVTAKPPRKQGTRIPEPFIVNGEMREWAARESPTIDVDRETKKFVNYWRARTRDATKLDWRGTWENWLMNGDDRKPAAKVTPEQRLQQTVQLATSIDLKGIDR